VVGRSLYKQGLDYNLNEDMCYLSIKLMKKRMMKRVVMIVLMV
jgi:hypothetical protein